MCAESRTRRSVNLVVGRLGRAVRRPWGNREWRAAVLEAAIERVTRTLVSAPDEAIRELVAERRAMREELDGLRWGENVVSFPAPRRES